MASKQIKWFKTHCARMDHGGCALLAGVRDNRIVKIKGDPDGFLNRGYICPKAIASELGVSLSLVYKWAQEQSESGSGSRNPLDRIVETAAL